MTNINVFGVQGIPEIKENDDIANHIVKALGDSGQTLYSGDIVIVTSKVISKAEGRIVGRDSIKPSPFAKHLAATTGRDATHVEIVLQESVRPIKVTDQVMIMENKNGVICANAGVDQSNIKINYENEAYLLLPKNPDKSATYLRKKLEATFNIDLAVIITDTFGRPWRNGQTNIAIGVSGMLPVKDYVGELDTYGNELKGTSIAVADQIAGTAELVMGKIDQIPVAVMRGYHYPKGEGTSKDLLRNRESDLFR